MQLAIERANHMLFNRMADSKKPYVKIFALIRLYICLYALFLQALKNCCIKRNPSIIVWDSWYITSIIVDAAFEGSLRLRCLWTNSFPFDTMWVAFSVRIFHVIGKIMLSEDYVLLRELYPFIVKIIRITFQTICALAYVWRIYSRENVITQNNKKESTMWIVRVHYFK